MTFSGPHLFCWIRRSRILLVEDWEEGSTDLPVGTGDQDALALFDRLYPARYSQGTERS